MKNNRKNDNLNFIFAAIFFAFSVMLFILWWVKGIFTLPAAIAFLIITIILIIVNAKANKKRNLKRQ